MEPGKMATISRAIPLDSELEATLRRAETSTICQPRYRARTWGVS